METCRAILKFVALGDATLHGFVTCTGINGGTVTTRQRVGRLIFKRGEGSPPWGGGQVTSRGHWVGAAKILRERAEDGPVSANELREIAAMLEAGQ